jgi:hypothetical protein
MEYDMATIDARIKLSHSLFAIEKWAMFQEWSPRDEVRI